MIKKAVAIAGFISIFFLALTFIFLYPPSGRVPGGDSFIVRVRLAGNSLSFQLSCPSKCGVIDPQSKKIIFKSLDMRHGQNISIWDGNIKFNDNDSKEKSLRIIPENGSTFNFDGTEYRGWLDVSVKGADLQVVNVLELEDYLKGVVPREVYCFWPMSALKAQAVASRSYAMFESFRRRKREYDLTSDTFTQVYGGKSAENHRTTKAVVSTRGEVLRYNNRLIPGYFHASCGGHTASISKVWGGADSEPFLGKRSSYCRWSPAFRWRARIPTATLVDKFRISGYGIDRIDDIKGGDVDDSGRLEYVRIRSRNRWVEMPINDFMNYIGRSTLKSSKFRIRKYPRFYDFNGYGWGHGVGMCQWCAFGLAIRGWGYKDILEHFYPGTRVVPI